MIIENIYNRLKVYFKVKYIVSSLKDINKFYNWNDNIIELKDTQSELQKLKANHQFKKNNFTIETQCNNFLVSVYHSQLT